MILPGIAIGFYGYLFPGNINLLVLELFRTKQNRSLFWTLALVLLFESLYASITLIFLTEFNTKSLFYKYLEIIAAFLILIMGIWMVLENKNDQKTIYKNTYFRGLFLIIIHPQQIPFWIFAGIFIRKIIQSNLNYRDISELLIGNGIGTMLIMIAYMVLGNKILNYFKLNLGYINKVMGVIYIALSLYGFLVF